MRRQAFRHKLHVVGRALPQKPAFAEQVMHLKRVTGVQPDRAQIDGEPTRLSVKAVKIHHDNDYARKVVGCLL